MNTFGRISVLILVVMFALPIVGTSNAQTIGQSSVMNGPKKDQANSQNNVGSYASSPKKGAANFKNNKDSYGHTRTKPPVNKIEGKGSHGNIHLCDSSQFLVFTATGYKCVEGIDYF